MRSLQGGPAVSWGWVLGPRDLLALPPLRRRFKPDGAVRPSLQFRVSGYFPVASGAQLLAPGGHAPEVHLGRRGDPLGGPKLPFWVPAPCLISSSPHSHFVKEECEVESREGFVCRGSLGEFPADLPPSLDCPLLCWFVF